MINQQKLYYICDDDNIIYAENIESKRQANKLFRIWKSKYPHARNMEIHEMYFR